MIYWTMNYQIYVRVLGNIDISGCNISW